MKVLFVCGGNVGRSQQAAALFNALSKTARATSAGTRVAELGKECELVGDDDPVGFVVAKEAGLDLSSARRRQVTPAMVESADRVVVMTAASDCPDFIRRSPKAVFWEIPDPRNTDYATRKRILNTIRERVEQLVKKIG